MTVAASQMSVWVSGKVNDSEWLGKEWASDGKSVYVVMLVNQSQQVGERWRHQANLTSKIRYELYLCIR
jgi:hypothetical protein